MGNGDREAADLSTADPSVVESALVRGATRRCPTRSVAQWPATVELEVADVGTVVFCHATPSSDTRILTTPDEEVAAELDGVTANVVVCGHIHVQYDRRAGDVRLVNAGGARVGMPYEGTPDARWLLLDECGVELVSTPYDSEAAYELLGGEGVAGEIRMVGTR